MAVDTISYTMVGIFGADNANELVQRYATWGLLGSLNAPAPGPSININAIPWTPMTPLIPGLGRL